MAITDLPDPEGLEETRAALAPTLDATAAILPWLATPRTARFDKKLNDDWIAAGTRLATAWSERHGAGIDDLRPAIFALYTVALACGDADALALGEALAAASDRLEQAQPPQLIAALAASIECLVEPDGLEHEAFAERARHFTRRLHTASHAEDEERSPVLDRLFVSEACEQLEIMHDALAALPPDAAALQEESLKLAQHAEQLALGNVLLQARALAGEIAAHAAELDEPDTRARLLALLDNLETSIAEIDC